MTDLLTVPRSGDKELRVSLSEYKGHRFINLRVFYKAGEDDMRPSKQGCTLPLTAIDDMIAALHRAKEMEGQET